jgi:hypothetical protein
MLASFASRALRRGAHEIVLHFRLRGRRTAKICARPLLEAVITLISGGTQEVQGVGASVEYGVGVTDGVGVGLRNGDGIRRRWSPNQDHKPGFGFNAFEIQPGRGPRFSFDARLMAPK